MQEPIWKDDVEFLATEWEISGDWCSFDVIKNDGDGLVMRPTADMVWRSGGKRVKSGSHRDIRIKSSDTELLMVIPKKRRDVTKG